METLIGRRFIAPKGRTLKIDDIKQIPVVLLLFLASWCPPCHVFIDAFKKFYAKVNQNCKPGKKNLEAIYVSCEEDEKEFLEMVKTINLPAVPYGSSHIEKLRELLDMEYIPAVVLVRKDGNTISSSIRKMIETEGEACYNSLVDLAKM